MNLKLWVQRGNPMLSNYTACLCCKTLGITETALRDMELRDIFAIPVWGIVAKREIDRWSAP